MLSEYKQMETISLAQTVKISNKAMQPAVNAVSICVHARRLTFLHTNRHRVHRD